MSLARGKGFMNKRGLPHGPRESSSSTCLLSEPGWKYTQLGWGQLAASEAQAWGGHPKTPKRGEPGGAFPGLIRDARPLLQGHLGGCAIQCELNKQQLYDKIHGHVSRAISGLYGDGHEAAVLDHREELCINGGNG